MDLTAIIAIVGVVSTVVVILQNATRVFDWVAEKVGAVKGRVPSEGTLPKRTMILQPTSHPRCFWWHMGNTGGEDKRPIMQVVGDLNVTNITRRGIFIMGARMKRPKVTGHALVRMAHHNMYSREAMILPEGVSQLTFDFWIEPPVRLQGEDFKADVAIIDQFGNHHWVKGIVFLYT